MKTYTKFWKKLANEKALTREDHVMHCALKAFFAKDTNEISKEEIFARICAKAFTATSNQNKLTNGWSKYKAIQVAIYTIRFKVTVQIFGLPYEVSLKEIFDGDASQFTKFNQFVKSLNTRDIKVRHYTYIFVDQDNVEPIHQAVQAAHVAMVIGQKMDKRLDSANVYYQICKKPVDLSIEVLYKNLTEDGFVVERFFEPDVMRTIAIGTHPVPEHKRKWLIGNELLTF